MSTQTINQTHRQTLRLCLCAIFTALSAIGAFLRIPIPYLPITLQNFFTTLAGLLLGARLGAASVGIYVLLGLVGVPIFTEGGGFMYVLKPSFGYLVGFVFGAFAAGLIAHRVKRPSLPRLFAASAASFLTIQIMGMVYFFLAKNLWVAGDGMSVKALFTAVVFPTVPGDIVKVILTALLAKKLIPLTSKTVEAVT